MDWDSEVSIVTRCELDRTVWGWNPSWGKSFCTHSDWSWGPPSHLYNRYEVFFLGVKWPGHGIDHPPPNWAQVKERYSYACTPHLVFMVCCRVGFTFSQNIAFLPVYFSSDKVLRLSCPALHLPYAKFSWQTFFCVVYFILQSFRYKNSEYVWAVGSNCLISIAIMHIPIMEYYVLGKNVYPVAGIIIFLL